MIIQVFSNYMIFPCMEFFLVIFQVFHDFQSLWEPCYFRMLKRTSNKGESVGQKVEGTFSEVKDTEIRSMIDSNIAFWNCSISIRDQRTVRPWLFPK